MIHMWSVHACVRLVPLSNIRMLLVICDMSLFRIKTMSHNIQRKLVPGKGLEELTTWPRRLHLCIHNTHRLVHSHKQGV